MNGVCIVAPTEDNASVPQRLSVPAIEWRDGQLWSTEYQDSYASVHGARAEREHVFLRAHGFGTADDVEAGRWLERGAPSLPPRFTFGELGFGAGVSFLVTWAAFRAHVLPKHPHAQLEWVSVEGVPLDAADLQKAALADPAMADLASLAQELARAWPARIPGLHRRVLDGGRVRLTLLFGAPLDLLPRMDFAAGAWNLDGFAPARNPEMWSDEVLAQVAMHSARGTTATTYSAATHVRDALIRVGFTVESRPGAGAKREITVATRTDAATSRPRSLPPWFQQPSTNVSYWSQPAIVIGAGLAGAAAARSLAERGIAVRVLDAGTVASGGSGAPRAILAPHMASWHGLQTRAVAHSFLHSRAELARLNLDREDCGLLYPLAEEDEWAHGQAVEEWGWPQDLMRLVDAQESAAITGISATTGAVWMPLACVTNPAATVRALLDHPLIEVQEHTTVHSIVQCREGWRIALAPDAARTLMSPLVVLATAGAWTPQHSRHHTTIDRCDALASAALPHVPLDGTRGQLSFIRHAAHSPRTIISSHGFVLPPHDGSLCLGATHERGTDSLEPTPRDDAQNIMQLERIAPALLDPSIAPERTGAWVGLRGTVNDHLPVVGAIADSSAFAAAFAKLCDGPLAAKWPPAPLLHGLYCSLAHGSRGTSTALLAGELLADIITGSVRCVTDDMLPTLLPQRFHVRALRRGEASTVT